MRQNKKLAELDRQVGAAIRRRCTIVGLTQARLAAMLGLSFQSVQKYESGENSVGASRLILIGQALDTAPEYFLHDGAGSLPLHGCDDALALKLAGRITRLPEPARDSTIKVLNIIVASQIGALVAEAGE